MKTSISYCVCPVCRNQFPIPRRPDRKRERGHIKTLYCPFCGKETDMIERREGDYMYVAKAETRSGKLLVSEEKSMVDALNRLCVWFENDYPIHHWVEDERGNVLYEERRETKCYSARSLP